MQARAPDNISQDAIVRQIRLSTRQRRLKSIFRWLLNHFLKKKKLYKIWNQSWNPPRQPSTAGFSLREASFRESDRERDCCAYVLQADQAIDLQPNPVSHVILLQLDQALQVILALLLSLSRRIGLRLLLFVIVIHLDVFLADARLNLSRKVLRGGARNAIISFTPPEKINDAGT